jgi:hypothetical protein
MTVGLAKEIKTKLEDTTAMLLQGAALDYTAYASLVARYRVLRELQDFIDERNEALNKGEVVDED